MVRSRLFSSVSSSSLWEEELRIIQELLLGERDCRLITLVGPTGTGKTRLARRAAIRVRDAFLDGVYAIRLAATPSADLLPAAIASGVGQPLPAEGAPEVCLLDGLRAKEMLLLLEGFEHLLEGAVLIKDLLLGAPGIKLLITSRVRLNLRAEWVRQTDRVAPPVAREAVRRTAQAPLIKSPAWSGAFLQADGGRATDGVMSCQRTNADGVHPPEKLAQAAQLTSMAGW